MKADAEKASCVFPSSVEGVGSLYIRAGEVEGDEGGEAVTSTAEGGLGEVSSARGACLHVLQSLRWRPLRAGTGGGFAVQFLMTELGPRRCAVLQFAYPTYDDITSLSNITSSALCNHVACALSNLARSDPPNI